MSNTRPSSRSVTPPKGRPTPRQPRTVEQANRRATLGWVGVGAAIVAIAALLVYLTRDAEPRPLHSGTVVSSTFG